MKDFPADVQTCLLNFIYKDARIVDVQVEYESDFKLNGFSLDFIGSAEAGLPWEDSTGQTSEWSTAQFKLIFTRDKEFAIVLVVIPTTLVMVCFSVPVFLQLSLCCPVVYIDHGFLHS